MVVGLIISISISVPIAVTITKRINPVSRSLADVCRTSLIWAFGLVITLTIGKNNESYILEDTTIYVNIIKFVGFIILIVGTMIYHDIIPLFNKKNKDSLLLSDVDEF